MGVFLLKTHSPASPTPLAALLSQAPLRDEIMTRVVWLIHLRYLAVAGVAVVLYASTLFPVEVPTAPQNLLLGALLITNIVYHFIARRVRHTPGAVTAWVQLAHAQISIDFIILTLQLHYAGGIENPFSIYYVFHTAFAGFLLTPRSAALEAAWGALLYTGMILGEGTGLLDHYGLNGWVSGDLHQNPWAVGTAIVPITTAMFFMTYLTSSISRTIGEKEDRRTDLQRDLKDRGDELARAYELLERGMKERETFLLTVEHELKSPLAAIRSNLEAILAAGGELSPLVRDMISRSSERTQVLLQLVRDLLALSRVEREVDAKVVRDINLSELIRDEVKLIRPLAEEKGLEVEEDIVDGVHIRGSVTAARYCVANLLSNAVRYTKKGSVRVTLQCPGYAIEFRVQDTGIGIASADQDRIFEEFYRTQAARRNVAEGTGVGMTVVIHSLEAIRGTIEIESEVGVGSTFRVLFPTA